MNFTLKDLEKFLRYISKKYKVYTLKNYRGKPGIILRHDIDLSIYDAYKIFKIEKSFGIKSTFFIMTSSECYNPFTKVNRKLIEEISDAGFEIGLHYDPSIYRNVSLKGIQKKAEEEAEMLEKITNEKVVSISQHRPAIRHPHGKYSFFKKFNNAYDPKYFEPDRYISDSRMQFKKDIYEFIDKADKFPLQILLHPFQYTRKNEKYSHKIKGYIKEIVDLIDKDFRAITTYRKQMKNKRLFNEIFKKDK